MPLDDTPPRDVVDDAGDDELKFEGRGGEGLPTDPMSSFVETAGDCDDFRFCDTSPNGLVTAVDGATPNFVPLL